MAQFAPVAPIRLLQKLHDENLAGSYHLLLAHDVVAKADAYRIMFQGDWLGAPSSHEVIMDNSAIELGAPVSPDVLLKAVDICYAKIVVLPDQLLDSKATLISTFEALKEWDTPLKEYPRGLDLMVVPQGKTVTEWTACALALSKIDTSRVSWWGIPRNFKDVCGESRQTAVNIAFAFKPQWKIHLLGFSEDTVDDILVAKDSRVYGIDSAVPVREGMAGRLFTPGGDVPPRGDWWDTSKWNTPITKECRENLNDVRAWIASWK